MAPESKKTGSLNPDFIKKVSGRENQKVGVINDVAGNYGVGQAYDSSEIIEGKDKAGVAAQSEKGVVGSTRKTEDAKRVLSSFETAMVQDYKRELSRLKEEGATQEGAIQQLINKIRYVIATWSTQGERYLGGNPIIFEAESTFLVDAMKRIVDFDGNASSLKDSLSGISSGMKLIENEGEEGKKRMKTILNAIKYEPSIPEGFKREVSNHIHGLSKVSFDAVEKIDYLVRAMNSKDPNNDTTFETRKLVLDVLIGGPRRRNIKDVAEGAGFKDIADKYENTFSEVYKYLSEDSGYGDNELVGAASGSIVAYKRIPYKIGEDGLPIYGLEVREKEGGFRAEVISTIELNENVTQPLVWVMDQYQASDVARKFDKGELENAKLFDKSADTLKTAQRLVFNEQKDVNSSTQDMDLSLSVSGATVEAETDQGTFQVKEQSGFQRFRNLFIQKLVAKYDPIYRLQKQAAEVKGESISVDENFELKEGLMYGKAAEDLQALDDRVKEITDLVKEKGLTVEEVENYLYAKHAPERNAAIEAEFGETDGSGMSNEKSASLLKQFEDSGKLESLAEVEQLVRTIQKDTRDTMVKFGLESEEKIKDFEQKYEFYTPLSGLVDQVDSYNTNYPTGGAGMHVSGTGRRAKGRKSEAPDTLAQIVSMNASVHIKARTNEAMISLYELVKNNPGKDLRGNPVWSVVSKVKENDAHAVGVRVGGKQLYIRFSDASAAANLRDMGVAKASTFVKMLRPINNWLRLTFTSARPEFIISNFARDFQAALFNAAAEADRQDSRINNEKIVKDIITQVPSALKALLKDTNPKTLGRLFNENPLLKKYYQDFKNDGGKTGWAYTKPLSKIAGELREKAEKQGVGKKLKFAGKEVIGLIEGVNDAVENSLRLSAYITAREAGVPREKAAFFAKNITVNFNRHGEYGQALNGIYLFFNAGTQSAATLVRSLQMKPKVTPDGATRKFKERVPNSWKIATGMALFGGMLGMINRGLSDDDEDGIPFYDKIPDYVKERNLIIMNPRDGKNYYKIPLPYGYSVFHNLGTTVNDVTSGSKSMMDGSLFLGNSIYSSFVPLSFGQSDNMINNASRTVLPTAITPFFDILVNETYFGSPVTREQFSFGVDVPESQLSFRSPKDVKEFFEWMNEATGGSDVRSGAIDINPDYATYMVEYFVGGTGRFISKSGQIVNKLAAKAEDNDYQISADDVPLFNVLYGSPSRYYDLGNYMKNSADIATLDKEFGDMSKRPKDVEEGRYKGVAILAKHLKDTEKKLKNLRKFEKQARDIEDMTERMIRLQELQDKKRKLYMDFNMKYENIRGNE